MTEDELKIGKKVRVSPNNEYYGDWARMECVISGLHKKTKDKHIDITIEDELGMECDGWKSIDLEEIL